MPRSMSEIDALTFASAVLITITAGTSARLMAQPGPEPMPAGRVELEPLHGGARDFDFLYGTWRVSHPRVYYGTSRSNQILDGRVTVRPLARGQVVADYDIVRADSVRLSGLELMLYDARTKQWAIHDAPSDSALLEPAYGHFDGNDGLFYGERELGGRRTPVRVSWGMRGLDHVAWAWSYSLDGGATWAQHWRMDLSRSGPAPGEPARTAPNESGEPVARAASRRIRVCCSVVESFRYVVPPGEEKTLTRLFNDETALLGDSGFVDDIALLRDVDRPNTYVWLRGFTADDAVRRFYYTPIWSSHREMLDRAGIRIDSAYSLRPGLYTTGFTLGDRLTQQKADESAGIVVATIYTFDWSHYDGPSWAPSLVPVMAAAGGRPLALFETNGWALEPPAANGARAAGVPNRAPPTGSRMVALFTWLPDVAAYERYAAALDRDPQYRDVIGPILEKNGVAPIAVWRLQPLAGSRAFRWSWEVD